MDGAQAVLLGQTGPLAAASDVVGHSHAVLLLHGAHERFGPAVGSLYRAKDWARAGDASESGAWLESGGPAG